MIKGLSFVVENHLSMREVKVVLALCFKSDTCVGLAGKLCLSYTNVANVLAGLKRKGLVIFSDKDFKGNYVYQVAL